MKRSIFFLVIILSFLTFSAFAENVLILTNQKSQETTIFRKGSYLVFELKGDNSVHEGFIREIRDSSIVFDDSQVSLSQINIIAGSTKAKIVAGNVANAAGNILLFAGTAVFDCGVNLILYNDYYYWPVGGTVWLAGAFIAGLGYAFDWALDPPKHAVRVRNYRKWNASIVASTQYASSEERTNGELSYKKDSTQVTPVPQRSKVKRKKILAEDDVYGN